jgi:L-asparaginase / beta-aspartyl-peptidase
VNLQNMLNKALQIVLAVLLSTSLCSAQEPQQWSIAIHGGAGANAAEMSPAELTRVEQALTEILQEGSKFLAKGGSALDCVEMVVKSLENCPEFNAGKGAVFNSNGEHELDASIMDGRDRSCGAVAGVQTVKNPVALARLVMERTDHVLLSGLGAEAFATSVEVERVPNTYFSTEKRRKAWEEKKRYSRGTVGCVAWDKDGNLAAATSTGGLTNKKWGRVGDSPIIGAGCYADNRSVAVSCTGTGEEYIRRAIAHDLSARMLYGDLPLPEAGQAVLESLPEDAGGLIAVDRNGTMILLFNTPGMARGASDSKGLFEVGVAPNH